MSVCVCVCVYVITCDIHLSLGANQSAALCCLLLQPNIWAQECTREHSHLQQAFIYVCVLVCVCVCVQKRVRGLCRSQMSSQGQRGNQISLGWGLSIDKKPLKHESSCGRKSFSKGKVTWRHQQLKFLWNGMQRAIWFPIFMCFLYTQLRMDLLLILIGVYSCGVWHCLHLSNFRKGNCTDESFNMMSCQLRGARFWLVPFQHGEKTKWENYKLSYYS